MKKIFSIIVITLMALSLYAGNVKGKQTKVLKTQWFDIIYRDGSERTVQILKDNLDDIFEDVNRQFGIEKPYFRMPVVVVQDCEQFNAYFTFAPYNHIVLYDTAAPASLKVFSETIVSTLRHEITHAVSMNSGEVQKKFSVMLRILRYGWCLRELRKALRSAMKAGMVKAA